jgi:hypothetical protein
MTARTMTELQGWMRNSGQGRNYPAGRGGQRGNAYLEYLVAAAAMVSAVVWFWDGGNYHGLAGRLAGPVGGINAAIGGPLFGLEP